MMRLRQHPRRLMRQRRRRPRQPSWRRHDGGNDHRECQGMLGSWCSIRRRRRGWQHLYWQHASQDGTASATCCCFGCQHRTDVAAFLQTRHILVSPVPSAPPEQRGYRQHFHRLRRTCHPPFLGHNVPRIYCIGSKM